MSQAPLSKYVRSQVDSARVARVWGEVEARLDTVGPKTRGAQRWLWGGVAAIVAAASAATATFVVLDNGETESPRVAQSAFQRAVLETAGDTLRVDLVDGSRIELAANTRVSVLEGQGTIVEVQLERGRVDCDLIPKPDRRFAVLARGVEVRVTGTKFSVQLQGDSRVDVAVERGSVEVTRPARRKTHARTGDDSRGRTEQPESVEAPTTRTLAAGESWSVQLQNVDASQAESPVEPTIEDATPTPKKTPPVTKTLSAKELLDQGNAARRAGDARGAAKAYETLLSKHGKDPRAGLAAFELGRLRMDRLGDMSGAIRVLRQAVTLAPGSGFREDAMARLVRAYAATGSQSGCLSEKKAYLKSYPNGVHAAAVSRSCGGD